VSRFLDALRSGRVLLMDGAMGTELQKAGLQPGECGELWNLTHPERVRAVHQAYVDAGAEVLLTNTFQAHAAAFARHHLTPDHLAAAWFRAPNHACSVRGPSRFVAAGGTAAYVLGDVGPAVDPVSGKEFADLTEVRQSWLDGVFLETFSGPEVRHAVRRARCFGPVCLSLTYRRQPGKGLVTNSGHAPEWFASRAVKWGAAALGVNCGRDVGMDEVIEIIRRYRQETDLPLFARPNAGTPTRDGDRWVYPQTPERMAARLPELLEAGASMVGGCCGTTPEHVAAFRAVLDSIDPDRLAKRSFRRSAPCFDPPQGP
jgi:5-methyltetrahydrofolate--homocysteine methyltransferase